MKRKLCVLLAIMTAVSVTGCGKITTAVGDTVKDTVSNVTDKILHKDSEEAEGNEEPAEQREEQNEEAKTAAEGPTTDEAQNQVEVPDSQEATESNSTDTADAPDPGAEERAREFLGLNDSGEKPVYAVDSEYFHQNSDDGTYKALFEGQRESILLSNESASKFSLLDKALTDQFKKEKEDFKNSADFQIEEAKEMYGDEFFNGPYEDTEELRIQRADSKVLSYYKTLYLYMGGAHGDYTIDPKTYDVNTGKELVLSDVISIDNDTLRNVLIKKIYDNYEDYATDYYKETYGSVEDGLKSYDINLEDYTHNDVTDEYFYPYTWYLSNTGINFYFSVYSFGSYADGATEVCIGYDEMPEIFNSKYMPAGKDGFIEEIGMVYDARMDIDGDGEIETVTMNYIYENNDYEYPVGVTLKVDDVEIESRPEYFYAYDGVRVYHVRTDDNRNYIYMMSGGMDDLYDWSIYDVSSAFPSYLGDVGFMLPYDQREDIGDYANIVNTDPDNMYFSERSDAMGTFSCTTTWHVGSDGKPEVNDPRRKINYHGDGVTIVGDFTVDVIDYDGTIESPGSFMRAGAKIYPIFTDMETYVDAQVDDGRYIRIYYTSMGYPATIEGTPVDEQLEGLMYAG